MTPWIRLGGPGGVPAHALGAVGDIEAVTEWPEGGTDLSFSLLTPGPGYPPQVTSKTPVDLMIGARPVWAGYLSELGADGALKAKGAVTEGDSTPCLDASGMTTSIIDAAIDSAISRGELSWRRPASINASAYGEASTTASLNTVSDLLAAWQTEAHTRVYVDPYRVVRVGSDPTVPEYHILPGADDLAWSATAQADRLIGRYQADAAGTLANVTVTAPGARAPYTVQRVDMTPRGVLTSASASAILQGILTDLVMGAWSGGVTISRYQIAGAPDLSVIFEAAGRGLMVRKLGQPDPRPGRVPVGYVDFVVGQATWKPAEGTITLTPVGTEARDLSAILAENNLEAA